MKGNRSQDITIRRKTESWVKDSFILIFFGFSIILILLSVILVLSFLVFFVLRSYEGNHEKNSGFRYQSLQYNQKTNETIVGIATIPRVLSPNEFVYSVENDQHILISKFGTNQYMCTGKCFCKERHENRRVIPTPIKIVICFAAAFSVLVAISTARIHFSKSCGKELFLDCDNVDFEVDECKPVVSEYEDSSESQSENTRKYLCSGKCVLGDFFWIGYELFGRDMESNYIGSSGTEIDLRNPETLFNVDGEENEHSEIISYFIQTLKICDRLSLGLFVTGVTDTESAKEKFFSDHLRFYCKKNSRFDSLDRRIWKSIDELVGISGGSALQHENSFCVGDSSSTYSPTSRQLFEAVKSTDLPEIVCLTDMTEPDS